MKRAALLLAVVSLAAAAPARAATTEPVDASEATKIADHDPNVVKERGEHPGLTSSARYLEGHWEIGYYAEGDEVALVLVDPNDGEVLESWTGYQVAWKMARGYSGAFGHKLDAPYVFIPLCLIFFVGLADWRRRWRVANLDLVVLLGFGVSHIFFNRAEIGVSVPLAYPVLVYLLARALWIGFRGRGEGLRPVWPTAWLIVAALFLMGFRIGLNMADSGAIDVGYAGVVGADRIAHGEPIYDNFPEDIAQGDTYGPVNYLAYVPFERIWPWSGSWDDLPAAHAAAVVFDLLSFGFLILLGLRIRPGPAGRRLAAILAFGWAAYPYTAFVLESNSNDALVAALLLATLLVLTRPVARGAILALATWAKFVPAVLAPMLLTYRPEPTQAHHPPEVGSNPADAPAGADGPELPTSLPRVAGRSGVFARSLRGRRPHLPDRTRGQNALLFSAGFLLVTILALAWPAINPGLHTFFDRSIGSQTGRSSPFSIWGQVKSLEPLRIALLEATAALAVALAFWPKRKSLVQVAALSAALLIALQITLHHWFYLYIVWFYPLLLLALAALPAPELNPEAEPGPSPARRSRPVPAG